MDQLPRVEGMGGVRLLGAPPDDPHLVRIHAAWAKAPSGATVAGWAAAVLHGVPAEFLDGTVDGRKAVPVDLCVPDTAGNYDARGLRPRRSRVPERQRVQLDGMVVTDPLRTILDLARWAPSEDRRLAMLDLGARHQLIEREPFAEFLDPLGGLHRLAQVRELVPLISARAESVPESQMRYHWIQAGLPIPVVNQPIYDRQGRFVARADLCDPESGLVGEYQGFPHRLDLAHELDAQRAARLQRMNMTVVEVWKEDRLRFEPILLEGYGRARRRDSRLDAWVCPEVEDW